MQINEINSMISSLNSIKNMIEARQVEVPNSANVTDGNDGFAAVFEAELNAADLEDAAEPETLVAPSASAGALVESYLTDSLADSRVHKPTVKELMDATGLTFSDAGSMIGVGAAGHADYRDWQKIMSSDDPAAALSAANGQLFSGAIDWDPHGSDASALDPDRVIAKSGSFALYQLDNSSGNNGHVTLQMIDGNDRRLSQAGVTGDQIARRAMIYGVDLKDLAPLIDKVDGQNSSLQAAMRYAASADAVSVM